MTERRYPTPREPDLRALAEREGPVLSLFVPVTAAVPDVAQNPVRHQRVVTEALERWRALGADDEAHKRASEGLAEFASESEAPAAPVAGRAAFWSADAGLAVFGLPFPVAESARVAHCAELRPIVRAAQQPGRYRVLALSAKRVALYEGDENALRELETSALPASLEDALGSELSEPSLQYHSTGRGGTKPAYHGHGGAPRGRRVDLERFHRHVARALVDEIGDDVVPLVLAADAQHRPGLEAALDRDVGLLAEPLEGNVDHASPAALHERTWPLVARRAEDARQTLERAADERGPLLTQLSDLVSQAVMGRIGRIWVPEAGHVPGRIDRSRARASEAWGDDDLIEELVVEVLRRGGEVEVVGGAEFSADGAGLAAELR